MADVSALPFRHRSFDAALAKDVLEHVQDPISVLAEIRRAVRVESALLITVPRAVPRAVWGDPTHVRGFTERALRTALELSGWMSDPPMRKMGSIPGAGRLRLTRHLDTILRIPIFGHWFGTNWMIVTKPSIGTMA